MKTYTPTMMVHLSRSNTTLATCMRIQRTDGNVYGFTTNRKILTISGLEYLPAASFNPTDIASANNLDTDNLTIDAFLDSQALTEDDLRAGRWDYAAFRIFQVNYNDLSMGEKKDRAGHLGEVTVNRQTFVAELLGLMEAYNTSIGNITQQKCRNNLGDNKCQVALTGSPNLTVTGVIGNALSDLFTLQDPARTEADRLFNEGVITILSGIGAGLRYEVKEYVVGSWTTKTPLAYDFTGASYTMHQGCEKRILEDCFTRFNNVVNFNGEPWLRGNDALLQVGRHS